MEKRIKGSCFSQLKSVLKLLFHFTGNKNNVNNNNFFFLICHWETFPSPFWLEFALLMFKMMSVFNMYILKLIKTQAMDATK